MTEETLQTRLARAEELIDLRHRVLRAGHPRESAHFAGDDELTTQHVAVITPDGTIVGCGTLVLNTWQDNPAWQLRGMAVDERYRAKGVGTLVLAALEAAVRDDATLPRQLWCNARTPAVGFYKKQGWEVVSEQFFIETAGPHFRMTRTLE